MLFHLFLVSRRRRRLTLELRRQEQRAGTSAKHQSSLGQSSPGVGERHLFSNLPSSKAISYVVVSIAMYVVSQITPLEWRKASVCNHDEEPHDNEFHLCKNSLNSFDGHEDFMNATTETGGRGNCCENYSTSERYLRNVGEMSEDEDTWMSIEHRRNFLERQRQNQARNQRDNEFGSSENLDEHLDIDDDGLIGFETNARQSSLSSLPHDGYEEIELISFENNFNLYNSFWWAMGTLIQTTSDLNPKVFRS